jgi:ABC-type methionine transport system ATPase subunit
VNPYFELTGVRVDVAGDAILEDITWTIPAGSRWSVVGPSGSGKSTLLRLLNRFVSASAGRVRVKGEAIERTEPSQLRRKVALVPQLPVWLPGTARDNLLAAARLGLVPVARAEASLPELVRQVGLDPAHLDRGEDALSVGQRSRVVLGRALLSRPEALLLDEPTSALDPPGAKALLERLRTLDGDLTMILVTHRLEDARAFGARAVVVEEGRLVEQGDTEPVLSRLEARWQGDAS